MVPGIDESIVKDIVDSLYWDDRVDASKVSVTVDGGKVTLSGTVPSYTAKMAAENDAWLITGVRDVDNQLKVDYPVEIPSESEIASNIRSLFTWDNDLFPYDLHVDVLGGWVTLEGTVDTYWKKEKAKDLASDIRGVIGVTNKIAVVPMQSISDERIAENIVNALDRSTTVNVDDINVKVENGEVILTGNVPSWTAKQAAYSTTRYTFGVKDVENRINIGFT